MPITKYECKVCSYLSTDFADVEKCENAPFLKDLKNGEIYGIENMISLFSSMWYHKGIKGPEKIKDELTDFGDFLFREDPELRAIHGLDESRSRNIESAIALYFDESISGHKVIRYVDENNKVWHVKGCTHLFLSVDPDTKRLSYSDMGRIAFYSLSDLIFTNSPVATPEPIIQRHYRTLDESEYGAVVEALNKFMKYTPEQIEQFPDLKDCVPKEGLKRLLTNLKEATRFGLRFSRGKVEDTT